MVSMQTQNHKHIDRLKSNNPCRRGVPRVNYAGEVY